MSSLQKKCKTCGVIYTYESQEELKKYFYVKKGYSLLSCKKCELEKHAKKYIDGKYNYRKKKRLRYVDAYTFGNNTRCCTQGRGFTMKQYTVRSR